MVAIKRHLCTGCGGCIDLCPALAIRMVKNKPITDPDECTECGICLDVCPVGAPQLGDNTSVKNSAKQS